MNDALAELRPWVVFAGFVLVVAVMYWAQAVLVPVSLAMLLTFVLARPVTWLQRRIGRVPAVLLVVWLVFTVLALAGWGVARQVSSLAAQVPGYRQTIRQKIADVRGAGRGGSVEKFQETIDDIKHEMGKSTEPSGTLARPVVVASQQVSGLWGFPSWLGPLVGPAATGALVFLLVVFMLLKREDLRDRILHLFGHGQLAVTTKAFDEAGSRVSHQLLMQSLVNLIYGVAAGGGLFLIGVPYALLWGALAVVFRFIPYVGPLVCVGAPMLVSLAALPGWSRSLWVLGLLVALELFTNLVLEPALYVGASGVSQVALLVAVTFWTWLWGSLGLLMAVPLTVCFVVLGKHVPGLEFVGTLMADAPTLAPDYGYYQRMLARDYGEASDLIERHLKTHAADSVYDALMLPALCYAERDTLEARLSAEEEGAIIDATRELLTDAAHATRAAATKQSGPEVSPTPLRPEDRRPVLGYAGNAADEVALHMLSELMHGTNLALEICPVGMLPSAVIALARQRGVNIVCLADLPPSPPSKARYLVKRLRIALPDVTVIVGRWAPAALADDDQRLLLEAGAAHVDSTLVGTVGHLALLDRRDLPGEPAEPASDVAARTPEKPQVTPTSHG